MFVAISRHLRCWGRSRCASTTPLSVEQMMLLKGVPEVCQTPSLSNAWQSVEASWGPQWNQTGSKQRSLSMLQAEEALSSLVQTALAADDLRRARQLCLRLLALQEVDGGQSNAAHLPASLLNALVCAHARGGDADVAFALLGCLEELHGSESATLPVEIFEALVEGLVTAGHCKAAFGVFQRMKTWAMVEPSRPMYVQMIKACGIVRDPDQAQSLFDEMISKHGADHKDTLDVASMELAIALASRRRTARRAFGKVREVSRGGVPLPWRLCVALARACAELGEAEEAKTLRRRMLAAGLPPDGALRADLVRAFGFAASRASDGQRSRALSFAWREVQEAVTDAKEGRGEVPAELLHAILAAYCSAGAAAHAEEILFMSSEELGVEAPWRLPTLHPRGLSRRRMKQHMTLCFLPSSLLTSSNPSVECGCACAAPCRRSR
eukprot:symbB.v1.2.002096.t1/scaffold114.1/size323002/2